MAKKCGCDAVKFQKRTIEIVYTKDYLMKKGKSGELLKESKKGLEFSEKEFDEIDDYCKKINIEWFASAWDIPSLDFLTNKPRNRNRCNDI